MNMHIKTILLAFTAKTASQIKQLEDVFKDYQIFQTASAASCTKILLENQIDLLVIDEDLPSVNEVIQGFSLDNKPGMVLVICAEDRIPFWESLIPESIDEFFKKPIRVGKLFRFIKLYLTGKKVEQYEVIFDSMPYGGEVMNQEGFIEEVSQRTCTLLGYQRNELLGKSFSKLLSSESIHLFKTNLQHVLANQMVSIEVDLKHKDGSLIPVLRSAKLIPDDRDPALSRILAFNLDISELVQERETTTATLRLLQDSQQVAKIGSFFYNLEQDEWTVTQVIKDMLALTDDHSRQIKDWAAFIGPNHASIFKTFIQQLPEMDQLHFELTYQMIRQNDQAMIWVKHSGRCKRNGAGRITSFTSTVQDITETKLQSESLKRSEQRLKLSQHLARLGTFLADPIGDKLTANSIFAEIVGIDNSVPLTYSGWLDNIHPGDRKRLAHKYEQHTIDRNTLNSDDFRIIRENDGEVRWVNELTEYQYDREGLVTQVSGTIQDITERILAQQKIEESEQILLRSQQVGRLGSYVLNIEAGKWNSSAILDQIFGIPENYHKDVQSWLGLVYESDRDDMHKYFIENILGQGQAFDKTYRILRKQDGAVRWVHGLGSLEFDEDDNPIKMFGTIQDVTRQKEYEAELRKLSFALEQSPASIVITDLQGNIEYVNAKFMEVTGYALDELLGQNPRLLSSGETSQADYKILWDTVLGGDIWQGEFHNKRKDGKLYWEWAIISPIRDPAGNITQILAVKEDITQKKIDAEKQHSLQEQLHQAQRMEAIGILAGGIAHDFNNILQSMYLYLGMAQDALPDGDVRDDIIQVSKAAQRAKDLVSQILTYSRRGETENSKVLIQFVVKEAIKFLKASFPHSIKVQEDINTECPPVYCDPTQIHQIFMNICTNAYDALPEKTGTIKVTLDLIELGPEKDEQILVDDGIYLDLIISDTGHGMSPAVLALIFNPFFSTKEPGMGTGLGLSVALGIMEELGGQILVESEEGQGSTFRLLFPTSKEIDPDVDVEFAPILDLEEISVLLVDSEDDVREGTQRTLEKFGCQVTSCQNSHEALAQLTVNPDSFSIVVADFDLSGMTGLKLAEIVKQDYPQLAFVLMSGMNPQELEEYDLSQVDALLKKPWQIIDLLATLSKVVSDLNVTDATHSEEEN